MWKKLYAKWWPFITVTHYGRDGVLRHQPYDCLLNRLLRRRSNKPSKLCVTGLCEGNSPVAGEFPAQRASNAENASIWWRHHVWSAPNVLINSLWPSDAIWRRWIRPAFSGVMACRLTAPRHYLNQCWLVINRSRDINLILITLASS